MIRLTVGGLEEARNLSCTLLFCDQTKNKQIHKKLFHPVCDLFEAESWTCKAGAYVTLANKGQSTNHQIKERV